MQQTVLISGGTGLVGTALKSALLANGHNVRVLSRQKTDTKKGIYQWDLSTGYIDKTAIIGISCIVHLAGAHVMDKPWSKNRRREILTSRVSGLELLKEAIKENPEKIHLISASGSNFYPSVNGAFFTEVDKPGESFISKVCIEWEKAANAFKSNEHHVSILRTGVVLSNKGGAYVRLRKIFSSGFGSSLGSGKQAFVWIHIQDLVSMYVGLIEGNIPPHTYNAVSPNKVSMDEFSKALAQRLGKWLLPINVPSFVLKLIIGKRANLLLHGGYLDSQKIQDVGFKFQFPDLPKALKNLV